MGIAVELELVLYPASHLFGNSVCHRFASLFLRNPYAPDFFFLVMSVLFSTDSYTIRRFVSKVKTFYALFFIKRM